MNELIEAVKALRLPPDLRPDDAVYALARTAHEWNQVKAAMEALLPEEHLLAVSKAGIGGYYEIKSAVRTGQGWRGEYRYVHPELEGEWIGPGQFPDSDYDFLRVS